ncbi:hypothetical protein GGI12_000349 [Dipsacomyces acuminosporus]|nr:hypothetical protein GGI12_000349 [Dipsacomyces acuminosporus]
MNTREQQALVTTSQALRLGHGSSGGPMRADALEPAAGMPSPLLSGRSGEIIQQVQQLLQEPFERLDVNGDGDGDTSIEQATTDVDAATPGQTTNSGEATPREALDSGHTWDFLTNAAQMFDRTAELREATMADLHKGYDMQGYQWRGCELQRRLYMSYRKQVYPQFRCVHHDVQEVRKQANCIDNSASFYEFRYSALSADHRCQINHFQLRDLIWATSGYDVFYYHPDGVRCWNPWKKTSDFVLSWSQLPLTFKLSSLCAADGFLFTGDYKGRYCVKSLQTGEIASGRLADEFSSDIANHATPCVSRSGVPQVHVAHNNGFVRQLDLARLAVTSEMPFEWAVNCTAVAPGGSIECVVGDCTDALLVDPRAGFGKSKHIASLSGHKDYSFACSFSPDGRLVATGNQDTTARVYDVRWPQQTLATLGGYLGAMRVVKFSSCGRFLLAAEPADYVHIYDTLTLGRAQDIEFMGEVSGAAFSPDSNCLFMGISDTIHGNALAEFCSTSSSSSSSSSNGCEFTEPWLGL